MGEPLFECAHEYDRMLCRGIVLSGENKHYFIVGRIQDMLGRLPAGFKAGRVLDFGCGLGDATRALAGVFPQAEIVGADTSTDALVHARDKTPERRVRFIAVEHLPRERTFDLCYVNGVFHHIKPARRPQALMLIRGALAPAGRFAFFENNPWNPGTRLVMSRIPFDRDAKPLSPIQARRLLVECGFRVEPTRYLFYFPRSLAPLRSLETYLTRLPLGAQYQLPAALG